MTELIQVNLNWLSQAGELLAGLSTPAFREVSGHLRHILEFYECFLEGFPGGHIDYDARRRDQSLERSAAAAAARIRTIGERLRMTREVRSDASVRVHVEGGAWAVSCVARELDVLSSHTIHHFALIAMTLRALGVDVDPSFGVAPSTLRYRAKQMEKAEAA
jgi:hypothetical protein